MKYLILLFVFSACTPNHKPSTKEKREAVEAEMQHVKDSFELAAEANPKLKKDSAFKSAFVSRFAEIIDKARQVDKDSLEAVKNK